MHSTYSTGCPGRSATNRMWLAAVGAIGVILAVPALAAGVLDRVKETRTLKLGYGDVPPFAFKDTSGAPSGFGVAVCAKIAESLKTSLALPQLAVDYVPVTRDERLRAVAQGRVDMLCDATVPTLTNRKEVSYSIPVFADGTSVLVRKDASARLKDILAGRRPPTGPTWRANADQLIRQNVISVVNGTSAQRALAARFKELELIPRVVPVASYAQGVANVIDGRANVFFGDRAALMDAVKRSGSVAELEVLDRLFSYDVLALAVPRDDSDFRLAVDSALSQLYRGAEFRDLYAKWFGPMNENALAFYRLVTIPE